MGDDIALAIYQKVQRISELYEKLQEEMRYIGVSSRFITYPNWMIQDRTIRISALSKLCVKCQSTNSLAIEFVVIPTNETAFVVPNTRYTSSPRDIFRIRQLPELLERHPRAFVQIMEYLDRIEDWMISRLEGLVRHKQDLARQYEESKLKGRVEDYIQRSKRQKVVDQLMG